jgi:Domain of unknown function (DUF5076)
MSEMYHALQIPPSALDKGGIEVLRTAIVNDDVHVTLRPAFEEPQAWGLLLAQVIRNVGRAYAQQPRFKEDEVIAQVRQALDQELQRSPTSTSPVTKLD